MTTIEAIKALKKTLNNHDFEHIHTILSAALLRGRLEEYNLEIVSSNCLDFNVMTYKLRPDQLIARPNVIASFSFFNDGVIQIILPRRSIHIRIELDPIFSVEVAHES